MAKTQALLPDFKKKKNKKVFLTGMALLILIILFLAAFCFLPQDLFNHSSKDKTVIVNIEKGKGLLEISSQLKNQGLISSAFLFRTAAFINGSARSIQAGTYSLSPSMSLFEILDILRKGRVVKERIKIIEGWNLKDIAQYLENKGVSQAEELFKITGSPGIDYSRSNDLPKPADFSERFAFLRDKPEEVGLEGYLFPDTYEIKGGEDLNQLVVKMLDNFDKKISNELRDEIKRQNKTLFEILTMASILEKEIKPVEDRAVAAGILWKRIKNNWPLQVDSTVTYITGRPSSLLTKADLAIDSRYNTYKYLGLPLGPICNPGLDSIRAAVYYKSSPYWFYLTTKDGRTIFSRSLREHAMNREKYLK